MPITVRQAIPGALGRLAVMAGQARGQQLQASRDIQFTQMALAAQDRAAARQEAASNRAFAMQRAAATQMAKQRPVTPDLQERRRKLRQFVSEATAADIYDPRQIKQMQIFADLGDKKAVESIASELPPVSVRRQEIQQQLKAVTKMGQRDVSAIQQQLAAVNEQLGQKFDPSMQQYLRENPEFMAKFTTPEIQKLMTQQQQLEEQTAAVRERTIRMGQMLQLGLTVPEQMAFEARQEAQIEKQEAVQQRLELQRAGKVGGLTEREELTISMIRGRERDGRIATSKEIERLSKDLAPFTDESEKDHAERIIPVQTEIRLLELRRTASHASEKKQIEEFLKAGQKKTYVAGQIITGADGRRYRFTRYLDGKPMVEEIE